MEQVDQAASKPLPVAPVNSQKENAAPKIQEQSKGEPAEPVLSIEVTSPPVAPASPRTDQPSRNGTTSSAGSSGSTRSHKRGISMDKMGITKLFSPSSTDMQKSQTNGTISRTSSQKSSGDRVPSQDTITGKEGKDVHRRPSTLQVPPTPVAASTTTDTALLSPDTVASTKKSRRNTLTVMVEPFRASLKQRTKGRNVTPESAQEKTPTEKDKPVEQVVPQTPRPPEVPKKDVTPATPNFSPRIDIGAVPASTLKANKVMQWFRSKSKGRAPTDMSEDAEKTPVDSRPGLSVNGLPQSTTSTVSQNSPSEKGRSPFSAHPTRAASNAEPPYERSFASALGSRFGGSSAAVARGTIRVHQGAVDQSTITTAPPPDVMKQVKKVLEDMGVEIQIEGDYKYRCIRPKRKKTMTGTNGLRESGSGLAAFTIVGSAASNGVDKRGLPVPSPSHSSSGGGMLRGLLMRRQSSQVSSAIEPQNAPDAALAAVAPMTDAPAQITGEPIYGSQQQDQGDEVRFSVELTRIDRLDGTYSLDIRRLKGNLRSYKFLYDTLRQRADLQR